MVVVTAVVVLVVMVVVVRVLVWDAEIINMVVIVEVVVIDVLADVEIIMVGVIVIVLKFVLLVSYSVDFPSPDVAFKLFTDALTDVMIGVLPGIDIDALTDLSSNAFAVTMTALEFTVSTSLEEFSRCAAFDCRSLALLDCSRVLQTRMPSCHV